MNGPAINDDLGPPAVAAPEVSDAVLELARLVLGHTDQRGVLERATRVAGRTIPGADDLSVTVGERRPWTVAAVGQLAQDLDESQYAGKEGPCLHALNTGTTVLVQDVSAETRWPGYTGRARERGVHASLSVPLRVDGTVLGAMNAYSTGSDGFGPLAVATAEELADYVAVVLDNAGLYFDAAARAEQMAQAMASRAVIEQAKGILMAARTCDADEAFRILVGLSQRSHRKLRDVAAALVEQTVAGR